MKELLRDNLKGLVPYAPKQTRGKIILDANENPYPATDKLKTQMIEKIQNLDFNRYPETNNIDLCKAYGEYAGVGCENVIAGNGSDEIIRLIITAFVDKDDYIVTHAPTFSMYDLTCKIAGGKTINVPSLDKIDVEGIIKACNEYNPKVVFICNPNNPTGVTLKTDDIKRVLDNTNAIVVLDEAYIEFFGDSGVSLINDYDRLVILRTLSKAFALAGCRIGFGLAKKDLIEILNSIKAPYNLNVFSQMIGQLVIENANIMKQSIDVILETKDYTINELSKIKAFEITKSCSNFLFIKVPDQNIIKQKLEKEQIDIRYFPEDYIRITIGTKKEMDYLISIFKKAVK